MTDRYQKIRDALAMEPTPVSWAQDIDGDAAYAMFRVKSAAEAAFITACDPETIRTLLEERDALADALEAVLMLFRNNTRVWMLSDEIERREREQRDEALLRQALDALAYWLEVGETPGSHDIIQRTHDVLRKRLK
jgi:hypothetical protein